MIKIVSMLTRKDGITHDEFVDRWRKHGTVAVNEWIPGDVLSGCRRYAQNYAMKLGDGADPRFDAIAESCFDDMAGVRKWSDWYFSEPGRRLRDDEDNFLDKDRRIIVVTEENTIFER